MAARTLSIRCIERHEWAVLRGLRLRAVLDSPSAFAADSRAELRRTPDDWTALFDRSRWIVASDGAHDIGLLRCLADDGSPVERHLESVWVDPGYRRTGVARHLVFAAVELERQAGVTDFLVWVLDGNDGALNAYRRIGFVPTGERQVLAGTGRYETRLIFPA